MEKTRKRKRAALELPGEAALELPGEAAPVAKQELEIEENWGGGGGVEDYPEKPVLSPKAEEDIMTAQNKAERGIRTIEKQESNTSALFSLLTEMREEMKRRDQQFKEELRWRDKTLAAKKKKNLTAVLQQRDEEWREELAKRDKTLRVELKEREKAFVQDQLMRNQELIKLMEVREKEME